MRTRISSGVFEVTRQIGPKLTSTGGGCNFGVVYEFVMKIYPHQGSCFGGMFFLTPDKIPGFVAAFEKFWRNPNPKSSFTVGIGAIPPTFQVLSCSSLLSAATPCMRPILRYRR